MPRSVRQRLPQRDEHLLADRAGYLLVQRPDQPQRRGEPERHGHLLHDFEDLRPQAVPFRVVAVRLQGEDRRPDLPDRLVQGIHRAADPVRHLRPGDQRHSALQRHPGRVEPLDHQVVQVAGDPVPVLEHR